MDEDWGRGALGPYHAAFWEIWHGAWDRWLRLPDRAALNHDRVRANVVWGYAVDEAKSRFDERSEVGISDGNGTVRFTLLPDVLTFRLKKMDQEGLSSNYPTQRVLALLGNSIFRASRIRSRASRSATSLTSLKPRSSPCSFHAVEMAVSFGSIRLSALPPTSWCHCCRSGLIPRSRSALGLGPEGQVRRSRTYECRRTAEKTREAMASDTRFNPDMLVLAREFRGMTQVELARATGATQGRLSKVENGLLEPSENLLPKLASALDYPVAFFFQQGGVFGLPVRYDFRKREVAPKRILERIHAEVNIRAMHLAQLMKAAEIEDGGGIPQLDIDDFDGDVELVAGAVRQAMNVSRGPIPVLVDLIENAGGIVVPADFGTALIDAVGMRHPGLPPLFFVNKHIPADRARFSLAHELGHVVMHHYPNPEMEKQADRFAAEFLMPAQDIRHHFGRVTLADLAALKPVWRVSMQALLTRARSLNKIEQRKYSYLWAQMSKLGYRRQEPIELDLQPERPRLMKELIDYHAKALGYSVDDLAELFAIHPHEARQMYLDQPGHLRLVS